MPTIMYLDNVTETTSEQGAAKYVVAPATTLPFNNDYS